MEEHYKVAATNTVHLVIHHARVVWIAFATLLAANSFFMTLAGVIMTLFPVYSAAAQAVGVVGAAICVAWILIIMRQSDYLHYYYACLRHFEAQALPEDLRFASMGASLADGQTLRHQTLPPGGVRLRWGSRLFKVEWLMYFVICVFLMLYLAVIFAPRPLSVSPFLERRYESSSGPSPNFRAPADTNRVAGVVD